MLDHFFSRDKGCGLRIRSEGDRWQTLRRNHEQPVIPLLEMFLPVIFSACSICPPHPSRCLSFFRRPIQHLTYLSQQVARGVRFLEQVNSLVKHKPTVNDIRAVSA